MPSIDWSDRFSVNVAEIDLQHQKLVSIIRELHGAMKEGKTSAVLGRIIDELIEYAIAHFSTEEKYFDIFNYPESASHKKAHDAFVDKIKDIKKDFDEGRLMLSIDIIRFLSDWWTNHIQGTDKKYSSFFNEKGLN